MKKYILSIASLLCCFILCLPRAFAAQEYDENYMEQMIAAACGGDVVSGRAAATLRDEKIKALSLSEAPISFDDLYLLSKIIYAEAGSEWLSDEWKMAVGEVVLNRVASPEFPNTLQAVLEQPGQYYGRGSRYFQNLLPSERCVRLAMRLLEGERLLCEPSVVFQANFPLGSGTYRTLYDASLGTTYLCYSSHRSLYHV